MNRSKAETWSQSRLLNLCTTLGLGLGNTFIVDSEGSFSFYLIATAWIDREQGEREREGNDTDQMDPSLKLTQVSQI